MRMKRDKGSKVQRFPPSRGYGAAGQRVKEKKSVRGEPQITQIYEDEHRFTTVYYQTQFFFSNQVRKPTSAKPERAFSARNSSSRQ